MCKPRVHFATAAAGSARVARSTFLYGATLNLTGNNGNTFRRSYYGSGNGTIQMSGGTLATDGTTTFNFGGALFQWTGGNITGGRL